MRQYKIVEKRFNNALGLVQGISAEHAIRRFKRLSGYYGDVVAVLW
jgi:hypothetical protein